MRGLSPGETRRTRIDTENAYGARSDDMLFSIPFSAFPSGLAPEVGKRVPLSNGMSASIVEVTEDNVRLDANHELAGEALTFDMQLVGFAETILSAPANGLERAVFGLGCFWGAFTARPSLPICAFFPCQFRRRGETGCNSPLAVWTAVRSDY